MAVPAGIAFNCGYARSAIREIFLKETETILTNGQNVHKYLKNYLEDSQVGEYNLCSSKWDTSK